MKFIETLVIAPESRLLEVLLAPWKPRRSRLLGMEVYRVEMAENLVAMFYIAGGDQELSPELLAHLEPHLQGILLVTGEQISQLSARSQKTIEDTGLRFQELPLIYALRLEKRNLNHVSLPVAKEGFYLRGNGSIIFWNEKIAGSVKNLWAHIFRLPAVEAPA